MVQYSGAKKVERCYTDTYLQLKRKLGQVVEKGSGIGIIGSTGNSTGTHLHFGVKKKGSLENPLSYVGR